jgi:ABC-type nitrate/sulfonate/bicarbonate transport system substrate-binding protein
MQSLSSHTRNIAVGSSLLVLGVLHVHGPAEALDSVSLITDFGYNGRHAYFFVALDKGYYKAAGLDVKILRGQGSVDAIRQVGAGNANFGFADTGSLVLARANDQIPVKLVASVYARPPQAITGGTSRDHRSGVCRDASYDHCGQDEQHRIDHDPIRNHVASSFDL